MLPTNEKLTLWAIGLFFLGGLMLVLELRWASRRASYLRAKGEMSAKQKYGIEVYGGGFRVVDYQKGVYLTKTFASFARAKIALRRFQTGICVVQSESEQQVSMGPGKKEEAKT